MKTKQIFKRSLTQCPKDSRVMIDPDIGNQDYVGTFGFEWTKIDGFIKKEAMSHGHIFGRFLLPKNFFEGKTVVDVGCGNGRIGRLIAPMCENYIGCDLSESVYAFPSYLKTKNISLVRASGTDLPLKDESTDVAICWGVLHHMDNPSKGLELLLSILNDNGFLKLGIYSELARQDIVKARKYIKQQKLKPTDSDIRFFREKIISGELNNLNSLKTSEDFYSLSQCRDLCFHSKEHRFTIQQLKEIFINNKLNFLGFFLPKEIKNFYGKYFPQDTQQIKLENWEKFENKHPATFNAMYQFWVNKITY